VETLDPLLCQGKPVVRRLASLYPRLTQRWGAAWGVIFHASNTRAAFGALRGVLGGQVRRVISAKLKSLDPDVVLSVHPLLNHVAYAAIKRSGRERALMTVVTDLIELHRGWALPEADLVVVPTQAAREVVVRLGVPAERVRVLGLPVDLRFRPPAPGERQALRRRWGLAEDRPTLLALGGGEGSGKLLQQVRALAWGEQPWQVIAVCGRNEKLRRRLARVRFTTPTVVLGFVDYMPSLMRAADLLVSKAGPGAITEALATGVPVILTGYLPGQETANVRFVTESGFGLFAPRPDELRAAVARVLAGDAGELRSMASRAEAVAKPYASLDIARECVLLADQYRTLRLEGAARGRGVAPGRQALPLAGRVGRGSLRWPGRPAGVPLPAWLRRGREGGGAGPQESDVWPPRD
jgi:1,2-diacylglycerol 3-beta-galactosyltransferase